MSVYSATDEVEGTRRWGLTLGERRLWLAAFGLWFVGDLAIVLVGADAGVMSWNPHIVTVANRLGVGAFPVLAGSKAVALAVGGVTFAAIDWEFRTLIPLTFLATGLIGLAWDLQVIRMLIF